MKTAVDVGGVIERNHLTARNQGAGKDGAPSLGDPTLSGEGVESMTTQGYDAVGFVSLEIFLELVDPLLKGWGGKVALDVLIHMTQFILRGSLLGQVADEAL
jgi:hypothetical protein